MSTWPTHHHHHHHHHQYTPISLKDQWTQQWSYHYPPPQVTYLLVKVSNTQTQNKSPPRLSQNPKLFPFSLSLSLNGSHETVNEALYRKTKARDAAMARGFQRSMLSSSRRHSLPQVPSLSLSLKFVFFLSFKYSITVYGFVSFYFWKAKVWWQVEKAFDQNRAMFSTEWFYFLRKVNFFESLYIL